MRTKRLLPLMLLMLMIAAGAQAAHDAAKEDTYAYYYNCFDWHCSAQYAKLSFEKPLETDYADILMFILNTRLIQDVSAHSAQEVVAGDQRLGVAYCCDAVTGISRDQPHNQYRRVNLEDADYYDEATAAKIRAVVRSGYRHDWTDDDLHAAQQRANAWLGIQGMDVIENLTHAQAMTATQLAIWLNANSARMTDADYAGLHDYSIYDVTTYDPVKVPSGVPADSQEKKTLNEANAKNVGLFKQYLLSLKGISAKTVIFTEESFVADSAMYAENPGLHDVTLRFSLKGTVSPKDRLTLTARMGSVEKQYRLGENATLKSDASGNYAISFNGMDAQAISQGVELTISGTQVLSEDAYFYEPRTLEGENPRDVSQNLVGYQNAETETLVFAACMLSVDPDEIIVIDEETVPQTGDSGLAPWVLMLCLGFFFAGKQRFA